MPHVGIESDLTINNPVKLSVITIDIAGVINYAYHCFWNAPVADQG